MANLKKKYEETFPVLPVSKKMKEFYDKLADESSSGNRANFLRKALQEYMERHIDDVK